MFDLTFGSHFRKGLSDLALELDQNLDIYFRTHWEDNLVCIVHMNQDTVVDFSNHPAEVIREDGDNQLEFRIEYLVQVEQAVKV